MSTRKYHAYIPRTAHADPESKLHCVVYHTAIHTLTFGVACSDDARSLAHLLNECQLIAVDTAKNTSETEQ